MTEPNPKSSHIYSMADIEGGALPVGTHLLAGHSADPQNFIYHFVVAYGCEKEGGPMRTGVIQCTSEYKPLSSFLREMSAANPCDFHAIVNDDSVASCSRPPSSTYSSFKRGDTPIIWNPTLHYNRHELENMLYYGSIPLDTRLQLSSAKHMLVVKRTPSDSYNFKGYMTILTGDTLVVKGSGLSPINHGMSYDPSHNPHLHSAPPAPSTPVEATPTASKTAPVGKEFDSMFTFIAVIGRTKKDDKGNSTRVVLQQPSLTIVGESETTGDTSNRVKAEFLMSDLGRTAVEKNNIDVATVRAVVGSLGAAACV